MSHRIRGIHPQFPLGHITPPRRIRVHPLSPPSSHHSDSNSTNSYSSSFDYASYQPHITTMLGTNVGVGDQGDNQSTNQGTPMSGTPTDVATPTPFLPFITILSLLDFNNLINDPLLHDPTWLAMPTKLPSDIPKFEGNPREDPSNHIHSLRRCCSSNSITEDSIVFICSITHSLELL